MNKSSQGVVVLLLAQWYLSYVLRKVGLVKAMVFPVVTYGYESWTIQKTAPKNWYFRTVALEKTLESSYGLQGDPISPS